MNGAPENDLPHVNEGDVLAGRYRVERVIAQGGMGIVVAARHAQLGQRVALKILHHKSGNREQSVARFLTEAKASALIRSDHVVTVSDVGTLDSGQPFMVMEFLEGADFAAVLEREGPLPVEAAVDTVLQALEGLAAAHVAKIVHRDLKPGNLFRVERGDGSRVVKVLDFGVSKALSADVRAEGTVTTTDAVFGSPLYMSPEQMQAATRADARSDIWSIGVVLFELLTCRLPFEADTMAGLAVEIATQPPKLLGTFMSRPPDGLDAVIAKCLEKRPRARYANVAELALDLEPFLPGSRARVERIERLLGAPPSAPRLAPTAPQRKVPVGAETLGPVDATPAAPPTRNRARLAIGLGALALVGAIGLFALSRVHAPSVAAAAPTPDLAPAPQSASPPVVAATVSAVPITVAQTAVAVTADTTPPVTSARAATPPKATARPAASGPSPAVSLIHGISRDRK